MNFSTPTTPPAPNYGIKRRNSFYSPSLEFQNHNDGAHCTDDEHEGPQELTDPGPNVRSLYSIDGQPSWVLNIAFGEAGANTRLTEAKTTIRTQDKCGAAADLRLKARGCW